LNRSFSLMFSLSTSMEFFSFYFDLKITEWNKQSLLFYFCFLFVLLIKVFFFLTKGIFIFFIIVNLCWSMWPSNHKG
jgi:hypothetical protein